MVVCSSSQPMLDITIYPPTGPAFSLALFPSSNRCGTTPKSTSLWDPASLLAHRLVSTPFWGTGRRRAHRLVSGSDTICNGSDPPRADIVLFGLSLSGFPLPLYSLEGRFPHSYKWWFVLLPNQRGTSQYQ